MGETPEAASSEEEVAALRARELRRWDGALVVGIALVVGTVSGGRGRPVGSNQRKNDCSTCARCETK